VVADIVAFAQKRGIIILSDEIYRPLFHSLPEGEEAPPSILSFGYDQVVSTSSMSKCFSLAGLRLGWVATRDQSIKQAVQDAREYSCVTVSQLDDQVASYALSATVLPNILERNMSLARTNLALLEAFVTQHSAHCSWTKPTAGTMAFVEIKDKDGSVVNDAEFCIDVLEKTKVYLVPGSVAFGGGDDFKGYVRLGYVCHTAVLQEALHKLGRYFEQFL
jgi:aspartate/methionine/tyrosine aminotransferase